MNNIKNYTHIYEEWYRNGYMDDWPMEKKEQVLSIIRNLDLPKSGYALDFGCGNGIFTNIIKLALPNWNVYGVDISETAISNATVQFPSCTFMQNFDINLESKKFDFIFSHHVLEHVDDINSTLFNLNKITSLKSICLHIMPCGNNGSLEYKISKLVSNGIQYDRGGRFFFEEELHMRRLTSRQLNQMFEDYGYSLEKSFFSNHYFGAVRWISTQSKYFIKNLTDYKNAKSRKSAIKLISYRLLLLTSYYLQRPYFLRLEQKTNSFIKEMIINIFYIQSKWIKKLFDLFAKSEWNKFKVKENGSEMFLIYRREIEEVRG